MRFRTCLLLVLCLALGSCDFWRPAQGIAWEFERGGTRLLLVPTFHAAAKQPARLSPQFTQRLLASAALFVELNTLDPSVLQELKDCRHLSVPPDNTRVSQKVADRLIEVFPEVRDEVVMQPPTPSAASVFVTRRAMAQLKLHERHGLDLQLIELFKQARKPVRSLEDACGQMRQMGIANASVTDATVLETLTMYSSGDFSRLHEQVDAGWRGGSWPLIKCSILEFDLKYPQHRESDAILIESRNPGLAREISKVAVGDVQITAAVGASHFVGDRSLPLELLALGFRTSVDIGEWTAPCDAPGR
jgi:uncharacterized protein YbaP (TraB family)